MEELASRLEIEDLHQNLEVVQRLLARHKQLASLVESQESAR